MKPKLLRKIFDLFEAIQRDPFSGIGKPEALKGDLKGYWSRRISDEHCLVYIITKAYIILFTAVATIKYNWLLQNFVLIELAINSIFSHQ